MWSAGAKKKKNEDSSSEEESSSDEESSEEDSDEAGASKPTGEMTRDERKQQKAAQKAAAIAKKKKSAIQVGDLPSDSDEDEDSSDDDMPANPNHSKAARNQAKAPAPEVEEVAESVKKLSTKPTASMSRKERESMEAAQAKERYRKLHEAGKTDEAKADMARLKLIREKREAEGARKQVSILDEAAPRTSTLTRSRPSGKSKSHRMLRRRRRSRPRRQRSEKLRWANQHLKRGRNEADAAIIKFMPLASYATCRNYADVMHVISYLSDLHLHDFRYHSSPNHP